MKSETPAVLSVIYFASLWKWQLCYRKISADAWTVLATDIADDLESKIPIANPIILKYFKANVS